MLGFRAYVVGCSYSWLRAYQELEAVEPSGQNRCLEVRLVFKKDLGFRGQRVSTEFRALNPKPLRFIAFIRLRVQILCGFVRFTLQGS